MEENLNQKENNIPQHKPELKIILDNLLSKENTSKRNTILAVYKLSQVSKSPESLNLWDKEFSELITLLNSERKKAIRGKDEAYKWLIEEAWLWLWKLSNHKNKDKLLFEKQADDSQAKEALNSMGNIVTRMWDISEIADVWK